MAEAVNISTIKEVEDNAPLPQNYNLRDVHSALVEGRISEDDATNIYLDHKLRGNIHDLKPTEIKAAYKRKKVTESEVENYIQRKKNPVWWYTKDILGAVGSGIAKAAEETWNSAVEMSPPHRFIKDLYKFNGVEDKDEIPWALNPESNVAEKLPQPESLPGQMTQGVSQFATVFIPFSGPVRAAGIGKAIVASIPKLSKLPKLAGFSAAIIDGSIAGSGADYAAFDPFEGRIADFMDDHGILPDYLKLMTTNKDNPAMLERFKNVLEGAALGGAIDTVFEGVKILKKSVSFRDLEELASEITNNPRLSKAYDEAYTRELAESAGKTRIELNKVKNLRGLRERIKGLEKSETPLTHQQTQQLDILKKQAEELEAKIKHKPLASDKPVEVPEQEAVQPAAADAVDVSDPKTKGPKLGTYQDQMERSYNIFKDITDKNIEPGFDGDNLIKHVEQNGADPAKIIKHVWDHAEEVFAKETASVSHKATANRSGNWFNNLARITGGDQDAIMNQMRNWYGDIKGGTTKAYAMYRYLTTYADQAQKMAKEFKGSVEETLRFVEHLKMMQELQAMCYGVRAEFGRGLNMHNMGIGKFRFDFKNLPNTSDLPEYVQLNKEKFEKIIKHYAENTKDSAERLKFARFFGKGGLMHWLLSYRQAQLLWNPVTHLVNGASQTGALAFRIVAHTFAHSVHAAVHLDPALMKTAWKEMAGIGKALEVCFQIHPVKALAEHKKLRSAVDPLTDTNMSFKKAFMQNPEIGTFYRATLGREGIIDPTISKVTDEAMLSARLAASPLGKIGRTIDAALKLPFNGLAGVDEVFKTMGTQSEFYSLVYQEGLARGLRGDALEKYFQKQIKKTRPDLFNKAMKVGREITYQDELGSSGSLLNKLLNDNSFNLGIRMAFIPFYKTTVNILKFATKNSFLGALSKDIRADLMLKNGEVAMYERVARMAMGSAAMVWGWNLYESGKITGRFPPDERTSLREAGLQEYSYIRDDGTCVDLRRGDPFAMWLAFTADLHMAYDVYQQYEAGDLDREFKDVWTAGMSALVEPTLGATWMKGAKDFWTFAMDPEKSGHMLKQWTLQQAGSLLPGATMADYVNSEFGEDTYQREVHTMMDVLWKKLDPSKLMQKRSELYGTPIERERRWGHVLNVKTMSDDPVHQAILANGVNLRKTRDYLEADGARVKLTPQDVNRFKEIYSQFPVKEVLTGIVTQPWFTDETKGDAKMRGDLIRNVISEFREAAKAVFRAENQRVHEELIRKTVRRAEAIAGYYYQPDATAALYHWRNREIEE